MINTTEPTQQTDQKNASIGARLQSAREEQQLERKTVAQQLRLNEEIIVMLESDPANSDLPGTFVRGYIRAYGKLLHFPEAEIKEALQQVKPNAQDAKIKPILKSEPPLVTSNHYFMQTFTYIIIFTLIGLVTAWWYSHTKAIPVVAENKPQTVLKSNITPIASPVVAFNQTAPATAAAAAAVLNSSSLQQTALSVVKKPTPTATLASAANDDADDDYDDDATDDND